MQTDFIEGECDVRTNIDHDGDFICHGCKLSHRLFEFIGSASPHLVVEHLAEHMRAGHRVPRKLIEFWQNYEVGDMIVNFGIHYDRVINDRRSPLLEREFATEWEKICRPQRGINYGHGTLQDLMFIDKKTGETTFPNFVRGNVTCWTKITPRDAAIVATVIQWLGTNCGFSFLSDVLDRAGYKLVRKDAVKP